MIRYLHPNLKLTRTLTGRLATQGFPVLGLPTHSEEGRRIRGLVRAPKGFVVYECDYGQIEMRAMAHLSGDEELIDAYVRGEDIHAKTAHRVFKAPKEKEKQDKHRHRLPAKTGNFGVLMGLQEMGLTDQVHRYGNLEWSANCPGCKSYRAPHADNCDSANFFREFFKVYVGVRNFQLERRAHCEQTGTAYGMWGMEWALPGAWSPHEEVREATLRQSHALPIQEGAQRLIKLAMAAVAQRDLPWAQAQGARVEPMLQVHDSLSFVCEEEFVPQWHRRVKQTMESVATWKVPIVAEGSAGPTWAERTELQ